MSKKNFILSFLLIALFLIDIFVGNSIIWRNGINWGNDCVSYTILTNFRLPKSCTALLTGIALGVSGLLMQTFFRNPLAGPDVLGVSSGASLGVSIFTLTVSAPFPIWIIGLGQTFSAICGAFVVLSVIVWAARHTKNSTSLLIVGIMLGSVTSSAVCILQSLASPDLLKSYILWTMGNLSNTTWNSLYIIAPFIFCTILCCLGITKKLNLWLLGDDYAQNLGVSLKKTRTQILLLAGILSGTITAFVGPIAFIGIAVPHIARMIFRTYNHKILLWGCVLCGATAMLLCDIISQIPTSPMPINAVASLLGAPMIIWIILKGKEL